MLTSARQLLAAVATSVAGAGAAAAAMWALDDSAAVAWLRASLQMQGKSPSQKARCQCSLPHVSATCEALPADRAHTGLGIRGIRGHCSSYWMKYRDAY